MGNIKHISDEKRGDPDDLLVVGSSLRLSPTGGAAAAAGGELEPAIKLLSISRIFELMKEGT